MKLVSVIIPTYKGSSEIKRAIDSALCQSYKDIEIIVVDDNDPASEERKKTSEILRRYLDSNKDGHIQYIKHEKNLNGAAARNTGIMAANGEYIAFLDDDDYYLPDRIEKCVSYMQRNKEAVGVYVGVDVVDKNNRVNLKVRPKSNLCITDLLQKEMILGTGSNIFVKTDVARKIQGFDETFVRRQDIEFMIRVCHEGQVGHISERLIIKSVNGTINLPTYSKMKDVVNKFGQKFQNDIVALGDGVPKYYATQYRALRSIALYDNDPCEIREATELVKQYDSLSVKERLVNMLYLYRLRDNPFVKLLIGERSRRNG